MSTARVFGVSAPATPPPSPPPPPSGLPLIRNVINDGTSTASAQNVELYISFEDGDVEINGLEVRKANGTTPFTLQQVDFVNSYDSGFITGCVVSYRQEDTISAGATQEIEFHAVTPGTSTANNTSLDDETDIAALNYTSELVATAGTFIADFSAAISAGRFRVEREGPVALTLRVHAVPTLSGTPQTSHLVVGFITLYSDGTHSFEGVWYNSFNQSTSSPSSSPILGITSLVVKQNGSVVIDRSPAASENLNCNGYMALIQDDGQPYFSANPRTIRLIHDPQQLNRCGVLPTLDPTNYLSSMPTPSARTYEICDLLGQTNEINAGGGSNHLGLLPKTAADYYCSMADATKGKANFREMLVTAHWLGVMNLSVVNTTNGWPWICNNTTYGSLTGSLNVEIGNGSSMTYTDSRSNDFMGNWGDIDPSHMVEAAFGPFVFSGRSLFFELMMIEANHILLASNYSRSKTFSGTGVTINNLQRIGEVRHFAWGTRAQSNLMFLMPDGHPMHDYFNDMLTASLTWGTQVNKAINNVSQAAALHTPTEFTKLHNAHFWSIPAFMMDYVTIVLFMCGLRGQISPSDTIWTDLVVNFTYGPSEACQYSGPAYTLVYNVNNNRSDGSKIAANISQAYTDVYDLDTNVKVVPDSGCPVSGTLTPYNLGAGEGHTYPAIKNMMSSIGKAYAVLHGLTDLENVCQNSLTYLNAERVSQGFTDAMAASKVQWSMRDYRALT